MQPLFQAPIRVPLMRTLSLRATGIVTLLRALHNLRDPSLLPQLLSVPAPTTKTLPLISPLTNKPIGHVPLTPPSALPSLLPTSQTITEWRETPLPARLAILQNLSALLSTHAEDMASLIHHELGNPLPEARAEVEYAQNLLQWSSQPSLHSLRTSHTRYSPTHATFSTLSPVGPVLAVTPFNLPLAIAVRKLAPALAAGCTIVAKPSAKGVLPTLALARLLERAGLPPRVYTPVVGGQELVEPLLSGDHVRMLSFTGSTAVGRMLQRQAAWKRCLLELGGNAPFLVFDDCDFAAAVDALARNGLRCGGQTCIAANRVFVQEGLYEAFVAALAERVRGAHVSPVIDEAAKERILGSVRAAVTAGATVVVGGTAEGCRVDATVVRDVEDGMEVACEETFGPVFPVLKFTDEAEVVARANARGGLAAYVYTRDVGRGMRVVDRIDAGMVGLNSVALSAGETAFGGVAETGLGREGGLAAVEAYSETKFCVVQS